MNDSSDVDYVPTVFSFKKTQESSETQREREVRVKSRREIIEDREREMERHRAMQWKVFYFSETRSSCVKQEHRLKPLRSSVQKRKHQRAQHLQKRRQAL